jgi:hypothetical protein
MCHSSTFLTPFSPTSPTHDYKMLKQVQSSDLSNVELLLLRLTLLR